MPAVVGILQLTLLIRGARTLKDKRRVVRSIKDRLGHHYNISIAEVDRQEVRNQAVLGIAMMGADSKYVHAALDKILERLRVHSEAEVVDHQLELL